MIIYGTRPMTRTIDEGQFYCPQCDDDGSPYIHKSSRSWATLYFIPIFPIGSRVDYIECRRCKGTFKESVLEMEPPTDQERILRSIYRDLAAGTPIEDGEKNLMVQGADAATARSLIEQMAGDTTWECGGCGLHFVDEVKKKCPECGVKRPRR